MESSNSTKLGGFISNNIITTSSKKEFENFPIQLVSSEDIERLGEKWLQIEHLPNIINDGSYIVNTNNQHWWVAIFQFPLIFVIDPFGIYINGTPPKQLIEWARNHKFETIYASEIDIQNKKSNECGYICLYIVKHIHGKLNEKSFDEWIDKHFYDLNENRNGGMYNTKKVFEWCNKVQLT